MKKIISLLLAILMMAVTLVPAFAQAGDYNWRTDPFWQLHDAMGNMDGNFGYGTLSQAMFHITTKKVYPMGHLPEWEKEAKEGEEPEKYPLTDTIPAEILEAEGILLTARYVFACPTCGKYMETTELYVHYQDYAGKCNREECGALLPSPSELEIYRVIGVDPESDHQELFCKYNFTKYTDEVFGPTANLYKGGKDIPEMNITYETDEGGEFLTDSKGGKLIASIDTNNKTRHEFKPLLYIFLLKTNIRLTPLIGNYLASKFYEANVNFNNSIAQTWEKFLAFLVTW